MPPFDIVIFGTGAFAARILFDIAATASAPVSVAIAGRNRARLDWLKTAANARATIFGREVRVSSHAVDLRSDDEAAAAIAKLAPRVVVQAASAQPSSVIAASGDAWSRLVARSSLSITAVFQAYLTVRAARAVKSERPDAYFINCCYPDVVNTMLQALGLPVSCGVGNVAILGAVFGSAEPSAAVKVLAHYQTIGPWRMPREERRGPAPRVWIGAEEVADVFAKFATVKLTPEPVIEISGASGVPLIVAMATGGAWQGHAPGVGGLPGGYPAALRDGVLDLDLPPGLNREAAIAWNARFERESGLALFDGGTMRYTGVLEERLREVSPDLAAGFQIGELDQVHEAMVELRARLQAQRA